MTVVAVQHVSKQFVQSTAGGGQRVMALHDVSLRIPSGETLSVLGPSGCGKSTLLRLIAGLIQPDSGSIQYDGVELRDIPLAERGVGMVFQEGALVPHWEAEKSIGFHLWLQHRAVEVPARIDRISQITGFGMEALLDRKPGQLSGGERQRVGIARALARDPRVFLFDEPFSNLDAKLRTQARVELRRLLNEFPVTSIYVTHDQHEAVALGRRIAIMRDGHMEQVGSYTDLYENPINLFVATFFGVPTINLFEGVAHDRAWHGAHFGPVAMRPDLPEGAPVLLGIRAEHIHFAPEGVPGRVEMATPHYDQRQQELEVSAGDERWTMILALDEGFRPADPIPCMIDPDAALFFDPASGRRIG